MQNEQSALRTLLAGQRKTGEKKRTTLYIGKDCKPELAEAICKAIGYKPVHSDILEESGTAIFTAALLKIEELQTELAKLQKK